MSPMPESEKEPCTPQATEFLKKRYQFGNESIPPLEYLEYLADQLNWLIITPGGSTTTSKKARQYTKLLRDTREAIFRLVFSEGELAGMMGGFIAEDKNNIGFLVSKGNEIAKFAGVESTDPALTQDAIKFMSDFAAAFPQRTRSL